MRNLASLVLLVTAAVGSRAETILIRNATVLTVTKGTVENGSVLIENGKIAAVGANVSAPADI
jgi:imidazolonepropionase-like amidohydrolase